MASTFVTPTIACSPCCPVRSVHVALRRLTALVGWSGAHLGWWDRDSDDFDDSSTALCDSHELKAAEPTSAPKILLPDKEDLDDLIACVGGCMGVCQPSWTSASLGPKFTRRQSWDDSFGCVKNQQGNDPKLGMKPESSGPKLMRRGSWDDQVQPMPGSTSP